MNVETLKAFAELLGLFEENLPALDHALDELATQLGGIEAVVESSPLEGALQSVDSAIDTLVPPARAAIDTLGESAEQAHAVTFVQLTADLTAASREFGAAMDTIASTTGAATAALVDEGGTPLVPELTQSRVAGAAAIETTRALLDALQRDAMALVSNIVEDVDRAAQAATGAIEQVRHDRAHVTASARSVADAVGPASDAGLEVVQSHAQMRDQLEVVYDDHGARIQAAGEELTVGLRDLLDGVSRAGRAGVEALGDGLDDTVAVVEALRAELGTWACALQEASTAVEDVPQAAQDVERARLFSVYAMNLAEKMA